MNTHLLARTTVRKISYVYHKDGDIKPYINIYPLTDPSGNQFDKFPLKCMKLVGSIIPADGDQILITISEDKKEKPTL